MDLKIEKIILTRDIRKERSLPVEDDNTDVIVTMKSGKLFIASFFSFDYIEKYRMKESKNKRFLNGKYFWARGMLLINNCTKENVQVVVNHILEEGDFSEIFISIN